MTDETYPGTDLLIRTCYSADCQKLITDIDDLWVDFDSNCCVCTDCRNKARDWYPNDNLWAASIVPAMAVMVNVELNDIEEG